METLTVIANRQSCRAYSKDQISENDLQIILDAANAAPVGKKKFDEIKITVIQNQQLLDKMDAVGAAFFKNHDQHPLYGAPTVVLVSTKSHEGEPYPLAYCNAACIVENMALAATDLGLGNVYIFGAIMALSKNAELCWELKVPEGFFPASAIAIGKAAEPLQERELINTKFVTDYLR